MTRAGAVIGEQVRGDEMTLRISARGGMACPTVTLWPADADWACECNSTTMYVCTWRRR